MKKHTYIDLFCGAGGLTVGFGNNQFHLDLANDISRPALDTLKHNLKATHPSTDSSRVILGDIIELYEFLGLDEVEQESLGYKSIQTDREVDLKRKTDSLKENKDVKSLLNSIKSTDVLVGGPPCQGFSMIGRSKKMTSEERALGFIDDPRNQLFKYYLKFAEKLNPKIVLIENVKGLVSASGYRDLIEISLKNTGKYGYDVSSEILNAKDFGLAQHRERIFFIGVRKDLSISSTIKAENIFEEILKKKSNSLNVKDVISDLPQILANPKPNNYKVIDEISLSNPMSFGENISSLSYKSLLTKSNKDYLDLINKYQGNKIKTPYLFNHKSRYHNERDLFIYKNLVPGKYLNDPLNKLALSKVTYGVQIDENGEKKVKGFGDKYFKLNPNSVSKTIIAHLETDGNSYVHPGEHPRSISPREAARIQSFPDWYFFTGSTRNQFKQIGNAVPPTLASIIAKQFVITLNEITK